MSALSASAQSDTIRYVNARTGKYANDGKTWATAKDNVQDAINDLYNYMQTQNLHSGSVYVAAGTYTPSESTGDGSSVLSTSFKIYDGIHVYGGFNAETPEATPDLRVLSTRPAWRDGQSANDKQSTADEKTITMGKLVEMEKTQGDTIMRYDFKNATIFSGNHNTVMGTFKWNDNKKQYDTRFPGNSYHVVWFATNGYVKDAEGKETLYADSLVYGASLDGCIIQDGNAAGRSTADRDLNAFGGGVYMVQHATVRNCVIRRCSASRRGGGVYMDRGGTVKDCNIYQCQTLGIGVIDGYGGGVCMENNGVMNHCNVTNNMARTGGGLMIVYTPEKHPYSTNYTKDDFDPYASVCVFSNNNANTEGAGVVLYRGGVLNHCTIVNNECTGTDITIGGVRYGRTGGLFIYGAGSAFNSVVWGNTCAANNDIQYGYYATTDLYEKATAQRPRLTYMAFSNFDITDWGNALRSNVFQISKENFKSGTAGNYPIFKSPSTTAGANGATATPLDWMPNAMSYLQQKGVQVSQLSNFGNIITKSHSARDFVRNVFNPVSALGAFAIKDEQYQVAELPAVDGSGSTIPTLFVDPNRVITDQNVKTSGESWDKPLDNVSEAVKDMEEYINLNKDKKITKTQILVKQGTITTAGSSSYLYDTATGEADLQSAALHLLDNMLMYGGYSSSLKGTAVNLRNPKENVTRINGNIVGEYKYNSVHCVIFPNVHDVVLDGFYISYGNAEKPDDPNYDNKDPEGSYSYRQAYGYGGGIFIGARSRSDRDHDMARNVVRNCVISNCWAPMGGAAVFVSGDNYLSDMSTLQKAELTMENCIIHNNAVRNKQEKNEKQWRASAGIIQAVGNAKITMNHCTVVNNVGTVFSALRHNGNVSPTIIVNNSAIYSNATDSLTDRTQLKDDGTNLAALYYNGENGNAPTGSSNQIDTLYEKHTGLSVELKKLFVPIFGNDRSNDHTYPRFVNPVRTIFVQRNADDPTLYGGTIDYTPMNMNPMVNAATIADGEDVTTETDFVLNHRNYGGKPDIGAIENTTQPENGSTYFVRTNGSDSNDGLSWATAFATIGHALSVAKFYKKSVWVAKGVYKENLTMQNGVNVYGGFKSYGNPGMREGERDISNLDSTYQTIIDGQYKGHVLNQDGDFSNATLWEGITIQNGTNLVPTSMGSVSTITEKITNTGSSNWSKGTYGTKVTKTITRTFTSKYTLSYNGNLNYILAYGGGAYILKNATLKNCLIRYNHYFQSYPSYITVKVAPTTTYTTTTFTKASADAKEVSVTKDSVSNVPYMTYETPSSGTTFGSDLQKGGSGIYLGSGAVLENCVVRNNEGKIYNNTKRMVGCGILSDGGTVLNSLIVENYTSGGNCLGVAMYLQTKSFIYNTTIAYNLATNISGLPCCPGVWDHAANGGASNFANNCSKFYNTIFWANIGYGNTAENFNQVCRTNYRDAIGTTGHMINCYHSVPGPKFGNAGVTKTNNTVSITDLTQIYSTGTITSTDVSSNNAVNIGVTAANTNTYYTKCKSRNLFNESNYIYPTASSSTQISSIETDNPYSINSASDLAQYCINMGADEYGETMKITYGITEDIAGADRIQDCRIDKGAYEYNGASKIEPETRKETHKVYKDKDDMTGTDKEFTVATYYVSQNGGGGVADASSAANAACNGKLQQVLDAAGRYKYDHPGDHVVVKLAAFPGGGGYAPSRTTDYNTNVDINPRQFSIQIPHGVEVQGGWDENFTKRDPLNNKTLLTGESNYAYHVVTFTDYVFDENGNRISKETDADGLPIYELLSDKFTTYKATWEKTPGDSIFSRSIINGCYIENGQADGVLEENQRGGAAVVTGFADISNCVIQNNSASGYGGGLYVEPSGIVSGCILQDNKAAYGAGIAIAEPDKTSLATWAILAYNTIVYNNATVNGGGIFFNTNLRSIGNVVWQNESNDQTDIAGVVNVDATQDVWNFPVNYTAVTNVREAGVNNISVNSSSDEGVRWQADSKLKTDARKYQYYYLQQSSVLTRAALPYTTMRNMLRFFPGIDSVDIAGVKRMAQTATDPVQLAYDGTGLVGKDNVTTDIGARAINFAFKIQTAKVFYRLFVVHPTNVSNSNANALLESGDEIYKQVGSSFANPFQRLGDAFDYIMNVRQRTDADGTAEKDKLRNHRFEVFVAGGTYYPYTDMYGNQGDVRSNTFNIPEGVTVIGGIDVSDPKHMYCQETSGETPVNGVTLYGSTTDEIRNSRVRYDLNKNSVVEPWEMKSQTILSGLSVGSDLQVKNVYHVINCNADEQSVGQLPEYFSDSDLKTTTSEAKDESTASRLNRTIILDGLTIRDGSAMGYESSVQNKQWYYRGGGIFVSGTKIDENSMIGSTGMETAERRIPMVVSNTLFQNNSARLGGAIYTNGQLDVVGCAFVQNYSKSPDNTDADKDDRDNVAWSGGGAIATNDEVTIVNSIFANNEAKKGTGALTEYTDKNGETNNNTLGFGGVLWAGDNSSIAILNCNSVRNKAHSFPSIYNTMPNSAEPTKTHIAVNSIFWGNEVDKDGNKQLANFGSEQKEALFFCAYQDGHGLPVQTSKTDQRANDKVSYENLGNLFDDLGGNNNVIISDNNEAVDGPNFILPSSKAGVDGYMQSANWLISRVNLLTDAGWGEIDQDEKGNYQKDAKGEYVAHGIYPLLSNYYKNSFKLTLLPLGNDKYMNYADDKNEENTNENMNRISADPLGNTTKDYIDIGVYEYQHSQLTVADGDEVDVMWVSDEEKTGANTADGRSWDTPTSDLQRAIETLLLSRNDKPKVVKIMGGTYSPTYTLDESNNGFQIHTGANDGMVALKKKIISGHDYQAKSLTIEGGYSKEIVGKRDIEQYPTILEMAKKSTSTAANMAHLFLISDAEQWGTQGNRGSTTGQEIDVTGGINKSSESTGKVMPITFDGLTFVNKYADAKHTESTGTIGGAAIYYKEQFVTGATGKKSTTDHLEATDVPKLTIKNCIFQQNGADNTKPVPAVRVEQGGGRTLIYNSVFHSGSGNPLESTDAVSIVNCTFAMNGGHIKLSGQATGASSLYNSIIWRDDQNNNGVKTQYEGFSTGNAETDSVQYNAITGIDNTDENANHHNVGLDDRNYNAMEGPNFVNGDGTDISQRDYHINPGVRTLTRANYLLYASKVLGWVPDKSTIKDKDGNEITLTADKIKELLADTAYTKDLANKVRLYDGSMERGAYECSSAMQRVLFVNPVMINTNKTTGLSWENAYGSGSIQRAIDAAAVYTYFNKNATDAKQAKSYVFVKGANNDNATPEAITLRNGVSVYGSIAPGYTDEPKGTTDDAGNVMYNNGARSFENDKIAEYIKNVKASRPGLAAKTTHRTRVASISTMAMKTGYGFGALVDGVEVRGDKTKTITDPVINIKDHIDSLVLRNMIIDGNTVSENNGSDAPVVNLQYGLLYNALLYGNTAAGQPIVSVDKDATMLNCTVVADAAGQKTVNNAGKVINCIDYNRIDNNVETSGSSTYTNCYSDTGNPFAPYLRADGNVYTLPAFLTGHAPYYYQLHESSKAINAGTNDVTNGVTLPDRFKDYVNLSNDRDLLGNPRTLGGTVDMGCFETWSIANDQASYATTDNNHYPHEGSVVYIGKNASLSLGSASSSKQIFTGENAFMPGYLLLKAGASLYGNGNIIHAAYVAAERFFPAGMQYTLMSLPFPYDYANALTTATDNAGNITETEYSIPKGKTYDGEKRSAWDYDFHNSDSPCWETMASTQVNACDGWLLNFGSPLTEAVDIRFTSFGSTDGEYVYSEDGKAKTVTLTQYNTIATGGSAHFTKLENMGWNLKGMPWLVSGYKPFTVKNERCAMNVPHVFYTLTADGNNFTTKQSWTDGSTLDFGSAFFTQTDVIGDKAIETVTFAIPEASDNSGTPAKPFVALSDEDGRTDNVEVDVDDEAKGLAFDLGSDGVKWQSFNDSVPQVYLLDNSGVALSLVGSAPVGVEMAMGYRAAKDGVLTVSLPDADAFDGQNVWLKDQETGVVTDLTTGSYQFQAAKEPPDLADRRCTA